MCVFYMTHKGQEGMYRIGVWVGEHLLRIDTVSPAVQEWICRNFRIADDLGSSCRAHLSMTIDIGNGRPFESFDVEVTSGSTGVTYNRADYRVTVDTQYREARVDVYDDFALKHALMNLYSTFVVHHQWGLLIHSSCAVQNDAAYLFAGQSGAGKSTVARLSRPRRVLSDEATVVKICPGEVLVFDSPFRSDSTPLLDPNPYRLNAIHLLRQSKDVFRSSVGRSDGILQLMNKVFYWSHDSRDTMKILTLHRMLADAVPIYDLYFQKNDTFWEAIS